MAHIKHPLVGDDKYVGKNRAKLDVLWCPRQFLHAQKLAFRHPVTNEQMEFSAPLADDLRLVLETLNQSNVS